MNVDILKIFVTVVEQKHFSRAAELLNLSQPGVSMHIRNLENEFDTTLIQRSPKHVQVTEAGNILYIHAKQMLSLYEDAKQEINELHNVVTGTLRIGASFTIGEYLLPKYWLTMRMKIHTSKFILSSQIQKTFCKAFALIKLISA